jgi:cyclic pyranopterin phosphate synthase
MPDQGVPLSPRAEMLTLEEVVALCRCFLALGVERVRVTGGEPTTRKGLCQLLAALAALPGLGELCLTTNGETLVNLAAPLRATGLGGLSVSLDSLRGDRFARLTRRGDLGRVLAGLDAARDAGFRGVRLNCVALRGFNDDELAALCRFAWERSILPRFIEFMPMSEGLLWAPGTFLPATDIRRLVEADFPGHRLVPLPKPHGAGPARYYRLEQRPGKADAADQPAANSPSNAALHGGGANQLTLGLIAAVSEGFCADCNRVRLSATGRLHTCLAHDNGVDLRTPLRERGEAAVIDAIRQAVAAKPERHAFTPCGCGGPVRHMVSIGG